VIRFTLLDRVDPGMRSLVLVLVGASATAIVGPLILFVTRPQDLALAGALLELVGLASVIVVIWGVYYGVRVLRGDEYGQRIPAQLAVVIGGLTLLPWIVALFS
jgi:hypothetical protein